MREVAAELKTCACTACPGPGMTWSRRGRSVGLQTAGWLVEHLLDREHADRAMRSIATRCTVPVPVHRTSLV